MIRTQLRIRDWSSYCVAGGVPEGADPPEGGLPEGAVPFIPPIPPGGVPEGMVPDGAVPLPAMGVLFIASMGVPEGVPAAACSFPVTDEVGVLEDDDEVVEL